jgi:hypothetical protein
MFPYKNPITPIQIIGTQSVSRDKSFGTNFSTLSTGGYMEVYSLDQLYYTIPPSTYGAINFSGNSIPIMFSKGSGTTFSLDTLTLSPDNISSGRRKIGMLVYVKNEDQVYQYNIDNYESLWNSATGATGVGGSTVVISDFGTTVKANSPEGIAFISGWTANTIDGVSGVTRPNAVWKKYYGNNLSITGGSYSMGTLTLVNITGGTVNITGISGGSGGDSITGGTFNYNTGTLSLNSTGGTITITGFTDVYVTGGTYNNSTGIATFTNNTGGTFNVSGFTTGGTSGTDVFVTGGTYSSGTAIFTNNTGGTFNVSGFYTGGTDVFVTGGTYSAGTITFTNITGGTFDVTGLTTGSTSVISGEYLPLSGGTVTGNTIFTQGLTATTISATTYQNLPLDVFVTGGTYSGGTAIFTNNTGGTFTVTGFTTGGTSGVDVFVTGGTYSNGTAIFTNNTGGTFNVSGFTSTGVTLGSFGITIDGGGSVITTGLKNYLSLPYNGYITGWVIIGDQSGSTSVDIWKDSYGNFPPTVADSITGGNYPSLSSQQINQDTTLSGWTTNFSVGDIVAFNVLSASTVTKINLTINVIKT